MSYKVLCVTDRSDLPETELFIGLKNAGVDISVICNPTGRYYDRLKNSQVSVIDLILDKRISFSGIKKLTSIFKQQQYDIVYCFNNRAISNALLAGHTKNSTFITYRGVSGNVSFLSPTSWMAHLSPRVKHVVCVSNSVRSYFLSLGFLGWRLNPEKPLTIYKGHDLAWYQEPPADLAEFDIPANAFVVAFAGRNRPNKGLKYVVESAKYLPADSELHYLLMGDLENDKALQQLIHESPLKKNIHLTGFRNDVPSISGACSTFIMPSVFKEGFSRAVIEAMAYGTPPIVTNIGGNPELVVNNESGIIIEPKNSKAIADAIMQLFNNPDSTKTLGTNAKNRIGQEFTTAKTVAKTKELFEELIKCSKTA